MGVAAFGATLKIGIVAVAELTGISGPSLSADTIDVTHHQSTDRFREFAKGIADGGEVSIEGNLTNEAGQAAILAAINATTASAFTITIPAPAAGTNTWAFNGFVTGFSSDAPFEDKASFSATIKVTGKPTLTLT